MKKNVVFRNYDRYAIKYLLLEIGQHKINLECENRQLSFPKRLALFFMEAGDFPTVLKYNYPNKGVRTVIVIDRFELPEKGWEKFELQ
jgi:hypothetical protein